MRQIMAPVAALAAVALVLSACGDDNDVATIPTVDVPQDTAPAPSPQLQTQPEPVQPLDEQASPTVDGVIEITTADVKFAPNRWRMSSGETVAIVVSNADSQPHNLRLAGLDGQYDTEDDAISSPASIGAGETGELSFSPQVAGDYTFRCDFHPGSMGGRIEVE